MTSLIAVVEAGSNQKAAGLYPALKTLDAVTPLETVKPTHRNRSAYVVVDKAWATHLGITRRTRGLYRVSRRELIRRLAECEARTVSVPDKTVEVPSGRLRTFRLNPPYVHDEELGIRLVG
jgi:hypothetical protein